MPVLELDVESEVCKWARTHGWIAAKLQYLNDTGWPDRCFIKNGIVLFVEFKRPKGGRREPKQLYWRKKILDHGGRHYFVNTKEEGITLLELYDA
jgi:hypothetical protein